MVLAVKIIKRRMAKHLFSMRFQYKKIAANAKGKAQQRCMFEGPLRTNLSSSIQQLTLSTTYLHTPDGATVSRECCRSWNVSQPKIAENP